MEIRELWVVEAGELGPYLAEEWGWQGVAQLGWLRRWRKRRPHERWSVEEVTIVSSRSATTTTPQRLLALLRQHWSIENRVHWPRDLSLNEDRLHGRQIGVLLAWLRNVAINLIRRHLPGHYLPDAWSVITTSLARVLRWLLAPLIN